MITRLWYPQLDVYDTVRRIGILLQKFISPPGRERLFIADFYLANPPLLHRATMSKEMRQAFSRLGVPRPEKSFLSYPSPQLLFHQMETIQKEALTALIGKGLISSEKLNVGRIELTNEGKTLLLADAMCSDAEAALCVFLTAEFAAQEDIGNSDLRRRTGIMRAI